MGIKESIWGALGIKPPEVSIEVIHVIRDAMLKDLGHYDTTRHPALFMKIYYAEDIDKLWDLRIDLLAALKEFLGDDTAADHMGDVTELFVGHHSAARKRRQFAH